jgi:hypothetical protein
MGAFPLVSVLLTASAQDRLAYYADADADGYGNPRMVRYATGPTAGYTRQVGDCDDTDARVHPGATEFCNDRDDDCDGLDDLHDADVVGGPTWYPDMDDDGFGNPRAWMRSCVQPRGFVDVARDCNDRDDMANPLAFEFCNDEDDDDCDGHVDECDVSLDDAALIVESSAAGTPARGVLSVADMNGDGTGDLVVGASYPYSVVYLVYGPATGTVLVDDAVTVGKTSGDDGYGASLGGGDADDDGFDDLLVGAPDESLSTTYLFLGPVTSDRHLGDADAVLTSRNGDYEGLALLVTTDHDGDGDTDVVVGAAGTGDGYEGAVYVAPGASIGKLALESDATYVYEGEGVDLVGAGVADLGDVNGDGVGELVVGATYDAEIFIIEGGMAPGTYFAADVASTTIKGDYKAGTPLQAIDYDGDGAMDLVAGDYDARNSNGEHTGMVYAFVGPWAAAMDADDAVAAWEWTSATTATGLGSNFAAADFDGNGETDLIIASTGNYDLNRSGAVFFQWGVASGLVDVGSLPYVTGSFADEGGYLGAALGSAVAALPDWNGDGIPEAAIEEFWAVNSSGNHDGRIYGFFSGSY